MNTITSGIDLRTLLLAKQGDKVAMNRLMSQTRPIIRKMVAHSRNKPNQRFDESDITQDSIIQVSKAFSSFDGATVCAFITWVKTIVPQKLVERYRHDKAQKRDPGREVNVDQMAETNPMVFQDFQVSNPEDRAIRNELREMVFNALPADVRQTYELFIQGGSYEEIAKECQIPIGTARSHVLRALKKISELYKRFSGSDAENNDE